MSTLGICNEVFSYLEVDYYLCLTPHRLAGMEQYEGGVKLRGCGVWRKTRDTVMMRSSRK